MAIDGGTADRTEADERPGDASRVVTWAGLLARWMEFARAAVALPVDRDGDRWRESVVPLITLHAVTMALGELELVADDDRAFARDRAAVMIRQASAALDGAWRGEPMPEAIRVLRDDALAALESSRHAGATELRWSGPGVLEMPAIDLEPLDPAVSSTHTLCVAPPGTPMMPDEPVAWWIGGPGLSLPGCARRRVPVGRQVYRILDAGGRAVRDRIVPIGAELPAGMPLLVTIIAEGRRVGRLPLDIAHWRRMQIAAMPEGGVGVEHDEPDGPSHASKSDPS